jgi:hypothetical protein
MESHGYTTPFPTDIPTWRGAGVMRFHADWVFGRGITFKQWGGGKASERFGPLANLGGDRNLVSSFRFRVSSSPLALEPSYSKQHNAATNKLET